MGLFRPKGLGEAVKCCHCGTMFFEIEDSSVVASLHKKYYPTIVWHCKSCGSYVCEYCMLRGCVCGSGRLTTLNVLKKMR